MSKAFTREDADASFELPQPAARLTEARLTAYGARLVRERLTELERTADATEVAARLRDLLERAEVVAPTAADHAALGARVITRSASGMVRAVVIVTPDEVGLVPSAVSAASPLARALLGGRVGETVEVELPRGPEELTITAIEWPS